MRNAVLIAALALAGTAGVVHYRSPSPVPLSQPMPNPSPVTPKPNPSKTDVIQGKAFEVVEGNKVKMIFTTRNGVPVVIVDDNGAARVVDLVKAARLLK